MASQAVQAVLETGRSSYTIVDVLEKMGVAVKIAHPNEVKAIAWEMNLFSAKGQNGMTITGEPLIAFLRVPGLD